MERKVITVGICDIIGFMKDMEENPVEEMVEDLQKFYEQVGEIVYSNNGDLIKYIGDAILFSFTSPQEAKIAGDEIRKLKFRGNGIRVSIATGPVVAGEVGHSKKRYFDVFGRTVNKAATLLGKAEKDNLFFVMCDETKRILDNK